MAVPGIKLMGTRWFGRALWFAKIQKSLHMSGASEESQRTIRVTYIAGWLKNILIVVLRAGA